VVVCSSDEECAELVPQIFHALKDESIVVVAGAPACMDELKEKGIMHFINIKSPLLESLEKYQKAIGIN
jgi:methylmalonyl-CoA mutase